MKILDDFPLKIEFLQIEIDSKEESETSEIIMLF